MIRRDLLPLLLLLAPSARAVPVPGAFQGLSLSIGAGSQVCARITFNRKVAEAGGHIFVVDQAVAADKQAIRLSEAVIARRGGLSSRVGTAARRHGVSAVALGQGRWDARGPVLYIDEPSYGSPQKAAGYTYLPVIGTEERALREGDAVVVDAAHGQIILVPPAEAEARVAAAEAARAYDGLRDVQALEQWLSQTQGALRGAALLYEMVPRAVRGTMPADDLSRVRRAAERTSPAAFREDMRRAEERSFARAVREAKRRAEDCASDAAVASDADVLERLADDARATAEGVASVARMLSLPDGGAAAAARSCRASARRRAKTRSGKASDFNAAAAAGGSDRPEGSALPVNSWARFVENNDLGEWLERTLDDSSLGLRRKSERIRERIIAGKLDASTAAGDAALAAATTGVLVIGDDAAIKASGREDILLRIKEVWAASWASGPLGARQRAGRGLAYDGRIRLEKIIPADAAGLAFSRDPGSGRRERLFVEAVPGSFERMLDGDVQAQSYALDRHSGRELSPRAGSGASVLSVERLVRVARLARALDAWKGAGVEVAFSFVGDRLIAHSARTLESPRPVRPLNDPFAPRPDAEFLNIRSVGR